MRTRWWWWNEGVTQRSRTSRTFSWLIFSGMTMMQRYPLTAHDRANPMPVFPEVGSMMVSPGRTRPSRSATSSCNKPVTRCQYRATHHHPPEAAKTVQ
jgi:hypothetical protein